jgi:hypothetical protein
MSSLEYLELAKAETDRSQKQSFGRRGRGFALSNFFFGSPLLQIVGMSCRLRLWSALVSFFWVIDLEYF